ncbi:MAG: DNA repair protein RadA [Candidatus Peribacteraceae bacterium]|nr:DNA repair protein RadA [Candidatus Peribacteraceae bacterium]
MSKSAFVCEKCGARSPRWAGQCAACGEWNSLVEEAVEAKIFGQKERPVGKISKPETAEKLAATSLTRITTGFTEADRVLGGGIVPGSLILLGGEPGIGKSTLTLQLAAKFAESAGKTLLVSGEESAEQIALRAVRLKNSHPKLHILSENTLENLLATAEAEKPKLLIVDSVQVFASLESSSMSGSIPQIRLVTERLLRFAKKTRTPIILIGHVTKDGDLAGPRLLAHLVDVVLTLEGDPHRDFRILRTSKNRFGATSEVGVFEMRENGLIEVKNPSAAFLEGRAENPVGSCVAVTVEGTRPLLVEVQALTSPSVFGYPKRTASGFDLNRLQLIVAVLQKHTGIKLDSSDVFVNVVGGFRLREPAADLAIALAIASSKSKIPLNPNLAAFGELGLTGEIRSVSQSDKRAREAKKMGFQELASGKEFRILAAAVKKLLK